MNRAFRPKVCAEAAPYHANYELYTKESDSDRYADHRRQEQY
jgi:hypothetical protein